MSFSRNRASQLFHAELRKLIEQSLAENNPSESTADGIHEKISHPLTTFPDVDQLPGRDLLSSDERARMHVWLESSRMLETWVDWIRITRVQVERSGIAGLDLGPLLDVDIRPALGGDWRRDGYRDEMSSLSDALEGMTRLARRQLEG